MKRFTLDLSPRQHAQLGGIALKTNMTKAHIMRKALALLVITEAERDQGNAIGIIPKGDKQWQTLKHIIPL